MRVVLVSTYDLGRQPFGLASPAAWLRHGGAEVRCLDLSRNTLDESAVRDAGLVAFYLPMHTATRLAACAIPRVRAINPDAHLCAYGLYAPPNADWLGELGVRTVLGGEFEEALSSLVAELGTMRTASRADASSDAIDAPRGSRPRLPRLAFRVPDRRDLPPLERYAALREPGGTRRVVGYTEASRGCKHLCRHCPVVPVYEGQFRVVPLDVVMADIGQQVDAGARHITFGDPDFLNGPGHAVAVVEAFAQAHPGLSYDVTVKVEHLVRHQSLLPVLARTGCAFVTTAVEAIDDEILCKLAKGHTLADILWAVRACREANLAVVPTFVAFTPWTSVEGYGDLLEFIARHALVAGVPSVQLGLRLIIPRGSRLLDLGEVRARVGPFDRAALVHPWTHPDPRVDELQADVEATVRAHGGRDRHAVFALVQAVAERHLGRALRPFAPGDVAGRQEAAYLDEPWYC